MGDKHEENEEKRHLIKNECARGFLKEFSRRPGDPGRTTKGIREGGAGKISTRHGHQGFQSKGSEKKKIKG